jgi:hypothetical protein
MAPSRPSLRSPAARAPWWLWRRGGVTNPIRIDFYFITPTDLPHQPNIAARAPNHHLEGAAALDWRPTVRRHAPDHQVLIG